MSGYFLLVPICLPLLGGVYVLLREPKTDRRRLLICEGFAIAAAAATFAMLFAGSRDVVRIYSFMKGFSIAFQIDGPAMLFAGMVSLMWPFVLLYAKAYMEGERQRDKFFAFFTATYGITLGVAFAANLVTMYVFFEMLTLVTIPLVSHYENHDSLYAGRKYAAYCIGGSSLGFIAVVICSLSGSDVFVYGGSLGGGFSMDFLRLVYLFGFFGFGIKAAIFPFHGWLPTAGVAPTPVTALLHAVAVVNTGIFAVTRLTWYVYGPAVLRGSVAQNICLVAAAFTLLFAAVMAVRERQLKRRLAYSTVSNLSYMLFGVALLTPAGLFGGLLHMLFHGIIKMSLFLCVGAFMHVTGKAYVYETNGAGRRMPLTFGFYTLGALSLTGIPLFCGFISKWSLLTAGADAGGPFALLGVICLILSAFLCAIYTLSVSIRAFFPAKLQGEVYAEEISVTRSNEEQNAPTQGTFRSEIREAPWQMLLPIGVFAALNVLFGIFPGIITPFVQGIANGLF